MSIIDDCVKGSVAAVYTPLGAYDEAESCRLYTCPGCKRAVIMRDSGRISHESPICEEFHRKLVEMLGREPTYLAPSTVQIIDPAAVEGEA